MRVHGERLIYEAVRVPEFSGVILHCYYYDCRVFIGCHDGVVVFIEVIEVVYL
ncbi:MAG: hypothetical protein QMD13_00175 [Candidatus Bathyarchaeia archaeon]|nr:hypothetical protein [Candidatus Bathyarchaeia archaeon]